MEILKKPIIKDVITSITYLLLVIMYFVCFNTQVYELDSAKTSIYINISSMTFLVISIIMFEVGFRKEKTKIFVNGVEFFILAISTLLISHMPRVLEKTVQNYTEMVIYAFVTYYITKIGILYTKSRYDKLKSMSDIKDIVKEEPTKKETKRKNKKEEGK